MVAAGTIHRLAFQYEVQGVDCWTRMHFINQTDYDDASLTTKAQALIVQVADRFRALLALDVTVRGALVTYPQFPNLVPFLQGANAGGARLGNSLPAMCYHQIHFFGLPTLNGPPKRNTMKISGISQIDHRQNHMIVNLELTKIAFAQYLRGTVFDVDGETFFARVVWRTPNGAPTDYSHASIFGFATPTNIHALKSRAQ